MKNDTVSCGEPARESTNARGAEVGAYNSDSEADAFGASRQTLRDIETELLTTARLSAATTAELLSMHKHFATESERMWMQISRIQTGETASEMIDRTATQVCHIVKEQRALERIEVELAAPGRIVNATTEVLLRALRQIAAELDSLMRKIDESASR